MLLLDTTKHSCMPLWIRAYCMLNVVNVNASVFPAMVLFKTQMLFSN